MKKRLTVDDIMEWIACKTWPREKIQEKFGKRKTVTPLQLAKAKGVSAEDKLWILLRPEIIPKKKLCLLIRDLPWDDARTAAGATKNTTWNCHLKMTIKVLEKGG